MVNPFSDPMAEFKLRSNPKTKTYLDDPDFVAKFKQLQKDPKSLVPLMGDKRIVDAVGAILGVNLSTMSAGEGEFH